MHHTFSIREALRFGWHKTRTHSGLVFKIVLTLLALEVANAVVQKTLEGTALGILAMIILTAALVVLGVGATRVSLLLAGGHAAHYRDIVPPTKFLWPYVAASVLMVLAVIGGLILLIIPGIIVAIRLSMVRFEVLEGSQIRASLHKSWEVTRGHTLKLLGFYFVLGIINILGAALFMVGLLLTMPISMLAHAHVYLKLKNKA